MEHILLFYIYFQKTFATKKQTSDMMRKNRRESIEKKQDNGFVNPHRSAVVSIHTDQVDDQKSTVSGKKTFHLKRIGTRKNVAPYLKEIKKGEENIPNDSDNYEAKDQICAEERIKRFGYIKKITAAIYNLVSEEKLFSNLSQKTETSPQQKPKQEPIDSAQDYDACQIKALLFDPEKEKPQEQLFSERVQQKKDYVIMISGQSQENGSDQVSTISQQAREQIQEYFQKEGEQALEKKPEVVQIISSFDFKEDMEENLVPIQRRGNLHYTLTEAGLKKHSIITNKSFNLEQERVKQNTMVFEKKTEMGEKKMKEAKILREGNANNVFDQAKNKLKKVKANHSLTVDEDNWSQTLTNGSKVDLKAPIIKSQSQHISRSKNKSRHKNEKGEKNEPNAMTSSGRFRKQRDLINATVGSIISEARKEIGQNDK